MHDRLTILQVIPRMRAGGAELGCLQVAEALIRKGHKAVVASEGGRLAERLEEIGGKHVTLPLATKSPIGLIRNARALASLIRTERADIIHARSRAPAWSALLAARTTNTAFVTTYHSEYSEKTKIKNLYNSVMARSDMVIAVSDYMAHLIRTRYHTPEERIAIIHRAFDPEKFDAALVTPERMAAVRRLLSIPADAAVLTLAGRITPRKAQQHLVEALGILRASGQANIIAVLAGEVEKPEFKAELEARARQLDVDSWLRFPGHVADMPATYLASDISLNISEQEGLPRVAIESQAMGTPLIVSDTGPGREVALTPPDAPIGEATGLRIPYSDPQALARAIGEMLAWPDAARKAMGERGRKRAWERFTLDLLTTKTLRVYETVLDRHRKAANNSGQCT